MSDPTILLGKGTYGGVYKTAASGVYKVLPHKTLAHTVREVVTIKGMSHPNVTKGYEVSYDNSDTRIRLKEYTSDLYSWSKTPESKIHLGTLPFVIRVLYGMVSGLYHIHSAGLVHADIKPQNILISASTGDIAYCDFNFCFVSTNDISPPSLIQTPNYRAPEVDVYAECGKYGQPIDIWSLGALIYWLLTGSQILPNDTSDDSTVSLCKWVGYPDTGTRSERLDRLRRLDADALYLVVRRHVRSGLRVLVGGTLNTKFTNRVSKLIAGCIVSDPSTRFTISDVFKAFTLIAKVFYSSKYSVVFRSPPSHKWSGLSGGLGSGLPSTYIECEVSESVETWPGCAKNAFGRLCEYVSGIVSRVPPGSPPVVIDGSVVPVLSTSNIQRASMYIVCAMYMLDLDMLYSEVDNDLALVVMRILELSGYNILHLIV